MRKENCVMGYIEEVIEILKFNKNLSGNHSHQFRINVLSLSEHLKMLNST